jgi:hypothetical protein
MTSCSGVAAVASAYQSSPMQKMMATAAQNATVDPVSKIQQDPNQQQALAPRTTIGILDILA